jgi:Cytochrome P450
VPHESRPPVNKTYFSLFTFSTKLPEVKQKLLAELAAFDIDANPLAVSRLPYLTAVYNETLRIYPVAIVAFLRFAKSPIEISLSQDLNRMEFKFEKRSPNSSQTSRCNC